MTLLLILTSTLTLADARSTSGPGPDSWPRTRMLANSKPSNDAAIPSSIEASNRNGLSWTMASKPNQPCTLIGPISTPASVRAPNCTVFDVTA